MRRLPWTDSAAAALATDSPGAREDRRLEDGIPDVPSPDENVRPWKDFVPLAAALAWGAGCIHATVTPDHFGESWAYGVFFVVAASAQFLWGVWAYRDPSRRVLMIGAIGSCAIAAIWLLSRTVGVPVTLGNWQREPIEGLDVLASVDEIATAVLIAAILAFHTAERHLATTSRLRTAAIVVGVLATASILGPMLGAHHHS